MNTSVIHWPIAVRLALEYLIEKSAAKNNGYVRIKISLPGRPRTTGEKSQNHRLNGFIQQICMSTGNDFDMIKVLIKMRAIDKGYPFLTLPTGDRYPKSESFSTVEECSLLIAETEQLAAEEGIRLKENTD
jgi:hypothetical protein